MSRSIPFLICMIFLLIHCTGLRKSATHWTYVKLMYPDSTDVNQNLFLDSINVECFPFPNGIEKSLDCTLRLGDLIENQEYRLFITFGRDKRLLLRQSIFRDDNQTIVHITKEIEGSGIYIPTDNSGTGGVGDVRKNKLK